MKRPGGHPPWQLRACARLVGTAGSNSAPATYPKAPPALPAGSRALGVQRGARVQRARHGVQHLPPELAVQQEAAVRGAGVAQHLPPRARPSAAPPGPQQTTPQTRGGDLRARRGPAGRAGRRAAPARESRAA